MQACFPRAKSWVTSWEAFGLQRRCDGRGLSLWSSTPTAALTWSFPASDLGFSCGFRTWHKLLLFLWIIHLKWCRGLFLFLIADSVKAQSTVHFFLRFHPKPRAKHTQSPFVNWLTDRFWLLTFDLVSLQSCCCLFFFFHCSASDLNVSSICTMVSHILFFLLLDTSKFT